MTSPFLTTATTSAEMDGASCELRGSVLHKHRVNRHLRGAPNNLARNLPYRDRMVGWAVLAAALIVGTLRDGPPAITSNCPFPPPCKPRPLVAALNNNSHSLRRNATHGDYDQREEGLENPHEAPAVGRPR